jgi:hypothetical protein
VPTVHLLLLRRWYLRAREGLLVLPLPAREQASGKTFGVEGEEDGPQKEQGRSLSVFYKQWQDDEYQAQGLKGL